MENNIKEFKHKTRQSTIITIVGIVIALSSLIVLIFIQEKTSNDLIVVDKENKVLLDSTKSLKSFVDSTKLALTQKEKALNTVIDFIEFSNLKDIQGLSTVLNDTLERFYLKKNISKQKIIQEQKWYWRKYPDAKYEFNVNDFLISEYEKDNYQIIVRGFYSHSLEDKKEVLSYIRVNKDYKIYFTRDYLPD